MFSIIDQSMGLYPSECVKKFMQLALKCCQDEPEGRPSMLEVVRELENIYSMLQQSEPILSESEATTSGMSGVDSPSLYATRKPIDSSDFLGSDLVSDIMPTIRPRWCQLFFSPPFHKKVIVFTTVWWTIIYQCLNRYAYQKTNLSTTSILCIQQLDCIVKHLFIYVVWVWSKSENLELYKLLLEGNKQSFAT